MRIRLSLPPGTDPRQVRSGGVIPITADFRGLPLGFGTVVVDADGVWVETNGEFSVALQGQKDGPMTPVSVSFIQCPVKP